MKKILIITTAILSVITLCVVIRYISNDSKEKSQNIDLCADDPDVIDPLRFLREREVVHFQRFGEALREVQDKLAQKRFYMNNMPTR